MTPLLVSVTLAGLPVAPAQAPAAEVRQAVVKGLQRIEQGSASYPKHKTCFSCHHQALPVMALASARQRGFAVDADSIKKPIDFSLKSFTNKEQLIKGQGVGGANT